MDFDGINLDFDGRNPFKVWRELYQVVPSSRPNRVKAINSEDITNLKIAFVIHDDVLDFLEDPYLFS
ncbi:MAG: hypothetical protein GX801_02200 [Fibrobacter sp.]|nr:hypothetical protein [Fibrobacter sp.]